MKWIHRRDVWPFIITAALASSATLRAAPILPTALEATRGFLGLGTLAKMTEIRLTVHAYPDPIRQAGMAQQEAREIWEDLLTSAGLKVVEDLDAPHLFVEAVYFEKKNRFPDTVAIGYKAQLLQRVHLVRLNRRMDAPTFSDNMITLVPLSELATAARGGCTYFARRFIGAMRMASGGP